jgi:hypothetical protein
LALAHVLEDFVGHFWGKHLSVHRW